MRSQIVELGVHTVAREAAVAGHGRRLVDERPLDEVADVGEVVELRAEADQERRLHVAEDQLHPRHRGQRETQRHQLARTGR